MVYADRLHKEISASLPGFSRSEWRDMQIGLFQNLQYHNA